MKHAQGPTNYDELYADVLLWLQKGWIDYIAPQLYWERGHPLASYDILLRWWNEHSYERHLYTLDMASIAPDRIQHGKTEMKYPNRSKH